MCSHPPGATVFLNIPQIDNITRGAVFMFVKQQNMNTQTRNTEPWRFLLGTTVGLAVSLCLLEYGKPQGYTSTAVGWHYDPLEDAEEIPIVIQRKLPEPPKPAGHLPRNAVQTASMIPPDAPEIVTGDVPDSLPEFTPGDLDLDGIFQTGETPEVPLIFVEVYPEFPGGERALFQFLNQNLRYPSNARKNGVEGIVYVQFVVARNGDIDPSSIEALPHSHPWLAGEAVRVIRKMPPWKPGVQQGRNVSVIMKLPVRFDLVG